MLTFVCLHQCLYMDNTKKASEDRSNIFISYIDVIHKRIPLVCVRTTIIVTEVHESALYCKKRHNITLDKENKTHVVRSLRPI